MPTRPLLARTLEKLAGSGLDAGDAALMHIEEVSAPEALAMGLPSATPGFKLPYFHINGQVAEFCRVRYMETTLKGWAGVTTKKPIKYAQPKGSHVDAYLPPFIDWAVIAEDANAAVVITEGELKAAAATKAGVPTIGLGGVWSFQSAKQHQPLIPVLRAFEWYGRTVHILFDSDAATNPAIVKARGTLAERLQNLGAKVMLATLQPAEGGAKVGLDDWLVVNNMDIGKLQKEVLGQAASFGACSVLHALNLVCTYVKDPGFVYDHRDNDRMQPSAFTQHKFAPVKYMAESIGADGKPRMKEMPAAVAWLNWGQRAECSGLTFEPGQPEITEDGKLNTWRGWGVPEPIAGDVGPWHDLMRHLFGKNEASRKWLETWLAYPLQNPGCKMATSFLMWGTEHGSGKTLVGKTLRRIYGENHSNEIHDTDLEDTDNAWAVEKQFILVDDIVAKGDRKLMRRLMTLVTQETVRVNVKYLPKYSTKDVCNYYYTSNSPDAFYMDDRDRRFYVFETYAGKFEGAKADAYGHWMDKPESIAALWDYFLKLDLTGFNPHANAPMTAGKQEMLEIGKSDLGAWVLALRQSPDAVLGAAGLEGDIFSAANLHLAYDPDGTKRASPNALARELKHMGFIGPAYGHVRDATGKQVRVYIVRNVDEWVSKGEAAIKAAYTAQESKKRSFGRKF